MTPPRRRRSDSAADSEPDTDLETHLDADLETGPGAEQLLAAALADVQPLPTRGPARVRSRAAATAAPRAPLPLARRRAFGPAIPLHLERDGERITGWRGELPPRDLAALGRPGAPIEATIDLHGLSSEAARERLTSSLIAARRRGARTVLVITGHGRARPGAGILRREVPEWLATPPVAELLTVFTTARPKHGGTGALYVRLTGGRKP